MNAPLPDALHLDAAALAALGHMGLRWVEGAQRVAQREPARLTPPADPTPTNPTPPPQPAAIPVTAPVAPPQSLPAAAPTATDLPPLSAVTARPIDASAWQDCRACPRGTQRQQALAGWGPWDGHASGPTAAPRLWLVLDAPTAQDDLSGPSPPDQCLADGRGALLDQFLYWLGWRREDIALTWAVQCHAEPTGAAPNTAALQACQPWLAGRLAAHPPAAVLALGRLAALALVGGQAPMKDLRPRLHTLTVPGRSTPLPVVVSFALDFLLANPVFKGPAWYDWCRAAALAQGQPTESAQPTSPDA